MNPLWGDISLGLQAEPVSEAARIRHGAVRRSWRKPALGCASLALALALTSCGGDASSPPPLPSDATPAASPEPSPHGLGPPKGGWPVDKLSGDANAGLRRVPIGGWCTDLINALGLSTLESTASCHPAPKPKESHLSAGPLSCLQGLPGNTPSTQTVAEVPLASAPLESANELDVIEFDPGFIPHVQIRGGDGGAGHELTVAGERVQASLYTSAATDLLTHLQIRSPDDPQWVKANECRRLLCDTNGPTAVGVLTSNYHVELTLGSKAEPWMPTQPEGWARSGAPIGDGQLRWVMRHDDEFEVAVVTQDVGAELRELGMCGASFCGGRGEQVCPTRTFDAACQPGLYVLRGRCSEIPPQDYQVVGVTSTSIRIEWRAEELHRVALNEGPNPPADCMGGDKVFADTEIGSVDAYTISGLESDTEYSLRICVVSHDDPSSIGPGETRRVTTLPPEVTDCALFNADCLSAVRTTWSSACQESSAEPATCPSLVQCKLRKVFEYWEGVRVAESCRLGLAGAECASIAPAPPTEVRLQMDCERELQSQPATKESP